MIHLLQFNKLEETKEYLEEKVNKYFKTNSAHIEDKHSSLTEIEQSPTSKTANNLSNFKKECST